MFEDLGSAFKKSDKSLCFMKSLLKVLTAIIMTGVLITAVVFWIKSVHKVDANSTKIETDIHMIVLGFVVLIGGSLATFLFYKLVDFFLWFVYDIKVIRTAVTKQSFSSDLKNYYAGNDSVVYVEKKGKNDWINMK